MYKSFLIGSIAFKKEEKLLENIHNCQCGVIIFIGLVEQNSSQVLF